MYVITHVATGAVIASVVPNPFVMIPLAFVSHFALDAIPHWHDIPKGVKPTKTTVKIAITDFTLSVLLAVCLINISGNTNLLYGIIAGTIMDTDAVWWPLSEKYGWPKIWPKYVSKIHGDIQNETDSKWGLATQLIVLLVGLLAIFNFNT